MTRHILTPAIAAHLGGLSPLPTASRRSTPPSRLKALAYRLRRALRQTWAELRSEAPVPLVLTIVAVAGIFAYHVYVVSTHTGA